MDFLQRNLFTKLRSENFGTQEELEAMTTFKKKKIAQMMKNLNNVRFRGSAHAQQFSQQTFDQDSERGTARH